MSLYKLSRKSKKFLKTFRSALEKDVMLRQATRLARTGHTSFYVARIAKRAEESASN